MTEVSHEQQCRVFGSSVLRGKRFNRRRGAVKAGDLVLPPPAATTVASAPATSAPAASAKPKDDSPSPKTDPKKANART
eukprot:Skav236542  [mRNA]  locus=scaffold1774:117774:119154:+ [translate_table: standard]